MLRLDLGGLSLPVDTEGRVRNFVIELIPAEFIIVQRVAKLHIVGVAAANEHIRLGDAKRKGIQLLPEAGDIRIGVQLLEPFLHAGEHLAGAHRHVVNRLGDAVPIKFCIADQQVAHEIDNIAAGEVRSGLLVVGLGEPLHQVLEDIAHIHCADFFGAHIALLGAEVHDNLIQQTGLLHAVDLGVEVHPRQNVLHIVRKAVQESAEILIDVFGVRFQRFEGKWADVIELVARGGAEEALLHGEVLHLLVLVQHCLMGRQQAVVEPLDDRHRQDDESVLMGLKRAKEGVCHIPN